MLSQQKETNKGTTEKLIKFYSSKRILSIYLNFSWLVIFPWNSTRLFQLSVLTLALQFIQAVSSLV